MAAKQRGRDGSFPPARPGTEPKGKAFQENAKVTSTNALPSQTHAEGVAVIGEAVRRVAPETAEFLIEITAAASTAAQALHDCHGKTAQIAQAIGPLGVQQTDIHSISLNVYSLYAPVIPLLPGYGSTPQIGQGGYMPYGGGPAFQPEVQLGSYHARNTLRIQVREAARAGEIVDAAARAGATIAGAFSFRVSDEAAARRAALEAAGKDARAKAETLAAAAGRQLGDPLAITEGIVASNGVYAALRSTMPFAFGAGTPQVAGELEY
jgi:uncharacterized protein YggE